MKGGLERIEQAYYGETLNPDLERYISTDHVRINAHKLEGKGSDQISNIMKRPLFDPVFRDVIVYPRVLDVLEIIL